MKAQFFNKPLNFKLNVEGEFWEQGSSVDGNLSLENTSSESVDRSKLGVHLCHAVTKKLKAKDPKGLKIIESIYFHGDQDDLDFHFELNPNCPITDSTSSLQILCGDISSPFDYGMMELKIIPSKVISQFIEVFEIFYRFKFKALKSKKDFIEVQLSPPATKEWAKIQKFLLQIKMKGEDLEVKCLVNIKTISFDNSTNKTKDERKEIVLLIPKKEHTFHGSVNQDGIKKHIDSVLNQLKLKPIL